MRTVNLEQSDSSIHTIQVSKFLYNKSLDKYLIHYYDVNENQEKITILEKKDNTFVRNSSEEDNILDFFYEQYEVIDERELPELISYGKKEKSFEVYRDMKTNKCYVEKKICDQFSIITSTIIKGVKYCYISEEDIKYIEEKSNNNSTSLRASYKDLIFEKNTIVHPKKPNIKLITLKDVEDNNTSFTYYVDDNNKRLFVRRNTYERIKKLNLPIEGKPVVIEDKNCYTITKEQLEEFATQSNLKAKKINVYLPIEKKPSILVYKDARTKKLYIPQESLQLDSAQPKYFMNQPCNEIDEKDLESIYNQTFVIATVYKRPPQILEVTLCNLNDNLFIPQELGNLLEPNNRKVIKVNNTLYTSIEREELDILIEMTYNSDIILNITEKKIIKKQ